MCDDGARRSAAAKAGAAVHDHVRVPSGARDAAGEENVWTGD